MLVHDDKPHAFWRITRFNQLLTGKDGLVRGAVVGITSGKDRVTELQWTLQLLYPLEVGCCVSQHEEAHQDFEGESFEDVTTNNKEIRGDKDVGNLPVAQPWRAAAE